MIFAVYAINIYNILKIILLLGTMHIVIALPAKKLQIKYVKYNEKGYKIEN